MPQTHAPDPHAPWADDAASNPDAPGVLVIEDDDTIAGFLADNLACDGHTVHRAGTLDAGWARLRAHQPDLVLLDLTLPDGSGLDLLQRVRQADRAGDMVDPDVPVVMLTARGDDLDRVRGFERGVDDYVVKPFHYPELLLRMQAVLRRAARSPQRDVIAAAGLRINRLSREVTVNGHPVELANKEYELLVKLASEPRRVFAKDLLLEEVWGYRSHGTTRTLDSHASRLRRKLRPHAGGREYIDNVWGVGYRLAAGEPVEAAAR